MRLPNKLFEYKNSILNSSVIVMNIIEDHEYGLVISELYKNSSSKIIGAQMLLESLEFLYALGKVEYDMMV